MAANPSKALAARKKLSSSFSLLVEEKKHEVLTRLGCTTHLGLGLSKIGILDCCVSFNPAALASTKTRLNGLGIAF